MPWPEGQPTVQACLQQLYAEGRLFTPEGLRALFAGSKESSWLQQFGLLAWRSGRDALRNKETIYAKVRFG